LTKKNEFSFSYAEMKTCSEPLISAFDNGANIRFFRF